jgi:hypothetical protein
MRSLIGIILISLLSFTAYAATGDDVPTEQDFKNIAISAVPKLVLDSARQAKPGVYLIQVTEVLAPNDHIYYDFDGSQVGKYWTIRVADDGKVLAVSQQNEAPVLH